MYRLMLVLSGLALIVSGRLRWQEADRLYDLRLSDREFQLKINSKEHASRTIRGCSSIVLGVLLIVLASSPTLVRLNQKLVCRD